MVRSVMRTAGLRRRRRKAAAYRRRDEGRASPPPGKGRNSVRWESRLQSGTRNPATPEAPGGFEPPNGGFADLCLTTWLRRRARGLYPRATPGAEAARAGHRTRTGDLLHGKQTLYQLSYARINHRTETRDLRSEWCVVRLPTRCVLPGRFSHPRHHPLFLHSLDLPPAAAGSATILAAVDGDEGSCRRERLESQISDLKSESSAPTGNRTPITSLKGWRPSR